MCSHTSEDGLHIWREKLVGGCVPITVTNAFTIATIKLTTTLQPTLYITHQRDLKIMFILNITERNASLLNSCNGVQILCSFYNILAIH